MRITALPVLLLVAGALMAAEAGAQHPWHYFGLTSLAALGLPAYSHNAGTAGVGSRLINSFNSLPVLK